MIGFKLRIHSFSSHYIFHHLLAVRGFEFFCFNTFSTIFTLMKQVAKSTAASHCLLAFTKVGLRLFPLLEGLCGFMNRL